MMTIVFFMLGLVGLLLGSDQVVTAAKSIAKRFNIPELLIGVTVVSIGTSFPEIMITGFSGAANASDLAIGAMIGSCLTQISLVLGITALIKSVKAESKVIQVDGPMMLVAILIFGALLYTEWRLSPFEGLVMITVYFTYIWYTSKIEYVQEQRKLFAFHMSQGYSLARRIFQLIIGIIIMLGSARFVVDNGLEIAAMYDLPEVMIGLFMIGAASCLPELATAIISVLRNAPDIAIGTLIGSSITNTLLATGIGALTNGFHTNKDLVQIDMPLWFVFSCIALLILLFSPRGVSRAYAIALCILYVVYVLIKTGVLEPPMWLALF